VDGLFRTARRAYLAPWRRLRTSRAGSARSRARWPGCGSSRGSTLNALRQTQLEQGDRLTGVEGQLGRVEGRLDHVEGRLDRVEARLSGIEARLDSIETRMADGFAMLGAGMARIVQLLARPA